MTDDTQSTGTDDDARPRRGPIGTVVGATLGPVGAALGTVVDDTRFALKFTMGTGPAGDTGTVADDEGTTIEIEDGHADPDDQTADADGDADGGSTESQADTEATDADEADDT